MSSYVEIANRALTELGAGRISDPDEASEGARVIKALWSICRRYELAIHPWSFALTRTSLPAEGVTPAWGWGYQYILPADYLKMYQVNDRYTRDSYSIENGRIVTDLGAPLFIRYVADKEDTAKWAAEFCEAFAMRLALRAAPRLTQSNTVVQNIAALHRDTIEEAYRAQAIEQPPQTIGGYEPWTSERWLDGGP